MRITDDTEAARHINAAVRCWQQGDIARDADVFVHLADPKQPLTAATAAESLGPDDGDMLSMVPSRVPGLVLVTQTCDVVRNCVERPFVEMAPLVEVPADRMLAIERMRFPAYAFVPAVAEQHLVADLDRIMTVEKSLLAGWRRTTGSHTDEQRRNFAEALARKRARFAFPDDFTRFAHDFMELVQARSGKQSEEGRAVDSLLEVRVEAVPGWFADRIDLMFWFIRTEDSEQDQQRDWSGRLERWLALLPDSGRFHAHGQVVPLSRMSALDYRRSDRLDLDRLTLAPRQPT